MSKLILLLCSLVFAIKAAEADNLSYTAQLSVKSMYLGKLGTTADDSPVLQPYMEINHPTGWYGYLWFNLPLAKGNPNRSFEIEPSLGYRHKHYGWSWDWSLTFFDVQNPALLDFNEDIISPKLMLSRQNWYVEAIHYEVKGDKEGLLFGAGAYWNVNSSVRLETAANYVDGPYHFEPIVYGKLKAIWSPPSSRLSWFVEVMDLFQEQNTEEPRLDQIAIGASFLY